MHQIAQNLISLEPQKDPALLSLYNFLKNVRDVKATATEEDFIDFYLTALNSLHWRSHRDTLNEAVRKVASEGLNQDQLEKIEELLLAQLVEIESPIEFEAILKRHFSSQFQPDKVKTMPIGQHRTLCLNLWEQSQLDVLVFKPIVLIHKATLRPLQATTHLRYDESMELMDQFKQRLEVDDNHLALFERSKASWAGFKLRGYTMKQIMPFDDSIENQADIFTALKQVEFHYISPESDPLYQETVQLLEKAISFLETGDEASETFARNAYRRRVLNQNRFFPNERYLKLLINNLDYMMNRRNLASETI